MLMGIRFWELFDGRIFGLVSNQRAEPGTTRDYAVAVVGGGSRSTRLGKENIMVGIEDKWDLPNVDPPSPAYPGPFNPTTIQ